MDDAAYAAIERRLERFLIGVGAAATLGAGIGWGLRAAAGAAIGTALCWLNFRWLRQGAAALIRLGAGAGNARKPARSAARPREVLRAPVIAARSGLCYSRLAAIARNCFSVRAGSGGSGDRA